MGLVMPYLEPGVIEDIYCDRIGCKNPNQSERLGYVITILCKECAEKLQDMLQKHGIDYKFEVKEVK